MRPLLGNAESLLCLELAGELACVPRVGLQAVAELSVLCKAAECVYTAGFSPRWWAIVGSKEENGTSLHSSDAHKILLE